MDNNYIAEIVELVETLNLNEAQLQYIITFIQEMFGSC